MNLESKIAELETKLNSTLCLVNELREVIQDKDAIIASQAAELTNLSEALSRSKIRTTSKNSHLSPSKDLTGGGKRNKSLRQKSGKPVGGQLGHKGSTLLMSDKVDEIVAVKPNYCNECGKSLLDKQGHQVGRRQVIDIPPIVPVTTEYHQYEVECDCGHCQLGVYPEGVDHPIQYGAHIQSMIIYQNVYQYMPFKRLEDFFVKIMGLKISKGVMENIIRRTSKKAQNAYEALRQVVEVSFFVGSDETGAKAKGDKIWFWVWQSAIVTYIVAACTRSKQVIKDTFPHGLPNSIICTDRLAAQLSTISKAKQICIVHLLRDLNYLIEKEQTQWAKDFKQLFLHALELKKTKSQYAPHDIKVIDIETRADTLLSSSFEQLGWTAEKYHDTITFFNGMVKLRHALFPFLYHAQVPPDNNGSERAVRPIKVKMKISGQFKSLQQDFAILRSVIDTAIKNGQPVFEAIQAIVALPKKQAG